nr:MAG TPA: hypothetical protein [Caudoviricetes sp.]
MPPFVDLPPPHCPASVAIDVKRGYQLSYTSKSLEWYCPTHDSFDLACGGYLLSTDMDFHHALPHRQYPQTLLRLLLPPQ